jgi:hypothetical protein
LRRKGLREIVIFILLAIAILFGFNLYQASEAVASNPTGPEFNDWALGAGAKVGAAVRDLSKGDGYPRRICAKGDEALLSSLSGTYLTTLREIEFPNYVVLPGEEPLLYVLVNTGPEPEALGPLHKSFGCNRSYLPGIY